MKEIEENLHLELRRRHLLLLEPLPSLPGFNLSRMVWVREIWVCRVCLLRGFYLGLISPACSFFVVCCFFMFLVWVSSSCFLFVFLLRLVWISGFLPFDSSSCSLGFFTVASFDLFMELESIMLDFHTQNSSL